MQHDARRDILIEPAARRRAAIETQGHSELGAFGTGAQSGRKNQLACLSVCLSVRKDIYGTTSAIFSNLFLCTGLHVQ